MAPCFSWEKAFFQTESSTVRPEWVILGEIVNGLVFIHSLGCVHRDLKPRNGFSPTKTSGCLNLESTLLLEE